MTTPAPRRSLYIDTSAAVKLMEREAESSVLRRFADDAARSHTLLVSSVLLATELRRVAVRHGVDQSVPAAVLDGIALADPDRALFVAAGVLPGPGLRSLDALHLASALRLGVDAVVAYDAKLCDAARALGLETISPT